MRRGIGTLPRRRAPERRQGHQRGGRGDGSASCRRAGAASSARRSSDRSRTRSTSRFPGPPREHRRDPSRAAHRRSTSRATSRATASPSCSAPRSRPTPTTSTRSTSRPIIRRAKGSTRSTCGPDLVLRTHTSPMQVRAMRKHGPPIAIIVPGKAYRRDAIDARHLYMFHQVEGLMVGRGIHFGHLKGMLVGMCRELFGPAADVRFRPSFFPFTEPSAEIDVKCPACRTGTRRAQGDVTAAPAAAAAGSRSAAAGWCIPNVLRAVGYDPDDGDGLGVRLRPGAHRDEAPRHERHPRVRRERAGLRRRAGLVRVPIAWLRDYADLPADADAIVARLAALGFPVDEVETRPRLTKRRRGPDRQARAPSQRRPPAALHDRRRRRSRR